MASIHRDVVVAAPVAAVWAALRDVGNPHRLFAGVLADARLDGDTRTVTFAHGPVVRERIVDVDEARQRVAYAVLGHGLIHHSASMQVFDAGGGRSRFVWITDVLPDDVAASFERTIDHGVAAMRRTLEGAEQNPGG